MNNHQITEGNPQQAVDTGVVDVGLSPAVFLFNPIENDQNNVVPVASSVYVPPFTAAGKPNPLDQWAVGLGGSGGTGSVNSTAQQFLASLQTGPGVAVLQAFGFSPGP